MNKLFFTLSSIVMLGAAQTKAQSNISIGPIGSIGASKITNVSPGADFKLSGAIGGAFLYSTSSHWGIGVQALASVEGYGVYREIQGGDVDYYNNPLYLRVPVFINYFFGKYGSNIRPKLYAGPSVGIKLSEKSGYKITNQTVSNLTITNSEQFKTFDIGVQAGAGVNIRVGRKTWLNLDAGYYQGFINVINGNNENTFLNQNIRFNAGLMFGI